MVPCNRFGFSIARIPFLLTTYLAAGVTMTDVEEAVTNCSECELTRPRSQWMTPY